MPTPDMVVCPEITDRFVPAGADGPIAFVRVAGPARHRAPGQEGPMDLTPLTGRDRAILRAVGRGSATVVVGELLLDGRCCSDQFAARRLIRAGLIEAATAGRRGPARLTGTGRHALGTHA